MKKKKEERLLYEEFIADCARYAKEWKKETEKIIEQNLKDIEYLRRKYASK